MASFRPLRAAVYARVSTYDQEVENQLGELRKYVEARGWEAREYVDEGVSGTAVQRPALDELVRDAKRRRFDVLVCWRLDRLGRSLKHLITLLDDLQVLGVAFVSLAEGIDATTPAGKLQMHILGAISEFERARCAERVRAGLARVRREGRRLGRPPVMVSREAVDSVRGCPCVKPLAASACPGRRRIASWDSDVHCRGRPRNPDLVDGDFRPELLRFSTSESSGWAVPKWAVSGTLGLAGGHWTRQEIA